MGTLDPKDIPRYDITVTFQNAQPTVWDPEDLEEVRADPLAFFEDEGDIHNWLRTSSHWSVTEVEER